MAARYWVILALIGAAFGASFAFNEMLLGHYGPLPVSTRRIAIGAIGCWVWVLATGRWAVLPCGTVAGIALFGVLQCAAPFAVLPLAQQHIASSTPGIANAMTPAAIVVISHLWPGGERATVGKLWGVAFGVAGIALLVTRGVETAGSDPGFVMLALAAPACYAIALNFVRRFRGIDPVVMAAWAMTGGSLAIAPFAVAVDGKPAAPDTTGLAALVMVPDTGERYLSTPLFEAIGQEMDAEEQAISNSTPLCRFGVPAPQPAAAPAAAIEPAPDHARAFVAKAVASPEQPVVMFALEWCEFSWAVRSFLKDLGVPFRSVDLDSVAMQADGLAGDIRLALRDVTGEATIPQVFVGGVPVGGAVDLLARHDRGELVALLSAAGTAPTGRSELVARSYLPKWLASRPTT